MPEGVGYGPQNTASTGLTLNYIGKHCYGLSGVVTDAASGGPNSTLLKFTTGNHYIIADLNMTHDMITGNNLFFQITFNGKSVLYLKTDGVPPHQSEVNGYILLIPPFTEFEMLFGATGVTVEGTGFLAGKVYS